MLALSEIFAREPLIGRLPSTITWAPDGSRFLYTLPGGDSGPLDTLLFEVATHRHRVFFRAAAQGNGARPAPEVVWAPDSRQVAYLDAGDLWVIGADRQGRRRLAVGADDPQWSPDSSRIAYVHAGDLYAVSRFGGRPVRYSFDGGPDVSNGDPDWAYSEELGMRHAFGWSPAGTRIAYLRFDQRTVAPFPIVDFLRPLNRVAVQRYPLAGGRNSIVTLRVAVPGGAAKTLYSTAPRDEYLASVGWTPRGAVVAQILDRSQRRLRYVAFGARGPVTLDMEHDAHWVDLHGEPRWLRDGRRFLFLSDRGGCTSLYIQAGRRPPRRLTRGYAVMRLAAIDEKRRVAFVEAAYPTRRDSTVLAVPFAGGPVRPLARGSGTHAFVFAADGRHFVRTDSAFGIPPASTVGSTLGGGLTTLARPKPLPTAGFGATKLFRIASPSGPLDAWMITPPGFDPSRRYPAITYVYGGPAAPTTADAWDGFLFLFHQALAQRGFIVFSVDGPGSQIDSAVAVRRLDHRLGPASLAGQRIGAAYLAGLPYVDRSRLGLWGWSFGGYETAFALTHAPGLWKAGVAVAPVTDWRYYDSIYTERYMGTPVHDPDAYRESSSVAAAGRLRGSLLIAHGTADDNVHLANSIALLDACVRAGKQVEFMVYPGKTHSIAGLAQRRHLFERMVEFWQSRL